MEARGLPISELDEQTRKELGISLNLPDDTVAPRVDALGKVLRGLKGLTNNTALWVLDQARRQITGEQLAAVAVVKRPVTVNFVVEVVATVFNLTIDDLRERSRVPEVALARQVAMYVLGMADKYTLTMIGDALGGRSPATVSYGFQVVAQRLKLSRTLRNKVEEIQLQIVATEP